MNSVKYQGIYGNTLRTKQRKENPFDNIDFSNSEKFCRWWKDLNFMTTLPYAKDRIMECHFWTVGVYFEPQYSQARIMLAKTIAMISIVYDTFNGSDSVKELDIYTDAIQRYEYESNTLQFYY